MLYHKDYFKEWRKFENSVIMGQDIAEYGGVFKITEGFLEKFGKDRVRNTRICNCLNMRV